MNRSFDNTTAAGGTSAVVLHMSAILSAVPPQTSPMTYQSRKNEKLLTALSREFSQIRVGVQIHWTPRLDLGPADDARGTDSWSRAQIALLSDDPQNHSLTVGQVDLPNKQATLRTWDYQNHANHMRRRGRSLPLAEGDYETCWKQIRAVLTQFGFKVISLGPETLPRRPLAPVVKRKERDLTKYIKPTITVVAILVIIKIFMYALKILERSSGL